MADNKTVNKAIKDVWDPVAHTLATTANVVVTTGDIEIGAVELKNASTDDRAKVATTSTVAEGDIVLGVQAPVLGATTDAAVTTDATATISARLRGLVNTIVARIPVLGQAAMAASLPVTIASNQSALAVSATQLPSALGQGNMAASMKVVIASDQSAVSVTGTQLPSTIGQKAMSASMAVVVASDQSAVPVSATQLPAALGQGTMSTSMKVTIASDQSTLGVTPAATEAHLGAVGGGIAQVTASFTRTNDGNAYAANDAVSNSTSSTTAMTFTGCARVSGGSGYIVGAEIEHEVVSITPRLRLHLYNAAPGTVFNDNAAFANTYAIEAAASYMGYIDFDPMASNGSTDSSKSQNINIRKPFKCNASANLSGLLQTLDAFTPGNTKSFAVKLLIDQN